MFTKLSITCTVLMAILPYTVYFLHKKIMEHGAQPWQKNKQKRKSE
ncbi:hypothetical protein [Bacillus pseudomycoides]|uniref:Uncharacterized protein n=1 Tax=Bacillus pseudomycoides TaxID=64104 RepID=A0A2C3R950_9BACI|nr:hypothetical protein [Bacillus pseudomycoides]PDY48481.1 hypothetical protein CON79_03855 [Bacillus pseudomycoides]PEA81001.1 hypothetical protein CON99_25140 [Bacillus pseudomycoides]PED10188.1 hypothetical protein COO19_00045 [Bacillus pseudomycoides]PED70225.1 hypothetical protein CON97_20740 [Bacillus pseudomycoides]PEE40735.1 hypothetical protein COO02_14625 [Bacillus pseudomycoides]